VCAGSAVRTCVCTHWLVMRGRFVRPTLRLRKIICQGDRFFSLHSRLVGLGSMLRLLFVLLAASPAGGTYSIVGADRDESLAGISIASCVGRLDLDIAVGE
jgi:hypothetical protein